MTRKFHVRRYVNRSHEDTILTLRQIKALWTRVRMSPNKEVFNVWMRDAKYWVPLEDPEFPKWLAGEVDASALETRGVV